MAAMLERPEIDAITDQIDGASCTNAALSEDLHHVDLRL